MAKRSKKTSEVEQQESEPKKPQIMYAGVSDRLFAAAIDLGWLYFIVVPVSTVLFPLIFVNGDVMQQAFTLAVSQQPELAQQPDKLMGFIINNHPEMFKEIMNQYVIKTAIQLAIIGAVIVPFIHYKGATPGKMLAGIKVVDGITYEKIGIAQSVMRYLAYLPSMGFLGLGVVWAAFNERKRTWHDSLADTVVIFDPNRWYKKLWDRILGR
jgi:uncharacterized RDD family membrane protein YckC